MEGGKSKNIQKLQQRETFFLQLLLSKTCESQRTGTYNDHAV